MRNKRIAVLTVAVTALGLVTTACGSSSGGSNPAGPSSSGGYDEAVSSIVNPSSSIGGTLKLDDSTTFDSLDPGVTYESTTWDLYRLFDRALLSYKQEPGIDGLQLEGDLAKSWTSSNSNKTWTVTIVDDAKFSDGDSITTKDIAYAIDRSSYAPNTISGAPPYFSDLLTDTNDYQGPYQDPNGQVSGIQTPNDTTIVFNLNQSFADFPYLLTLPQTTPIEPSHDPGKAYDTEISKDSFTGQYEVATYNPQSALDLVPNPNFVSSSDPNGVHKRYASAVDISLGVDSMMVDQSLLEGSTGLDVHGLGVGTGTQSIVLANPKDKANADAVVNGMGEYLSVNTTLKPFDNLDCRRAVEWAVNKTEIQDVSGGPSAGGQIASTVLPPTNTGYKAADLYSTGGEEGDSGKAAALVQTCKNQEGSSFDPSFTIATYDKASHPKFAAAAEVVASNLEAIGFKVNVQEYDYSTAFFQTAAGVPSFAQQNRIGLSLWAWSADFPTGYGYMDAILTPAGIVSKGPSYNLSYWTSTTFDNMLNQALAAPNAAQTDSLYAQADAYAMQQAVIVPLLYMSNLDYRPPATTNVTVSQAFGMYDYSIIGTN